MVRAIVSKPKPTTTSSISASTQTKGIFDSFTVSRSKPITSFKKVSSNANKKATKNQKSFITKFRSKQITVEKKPNIDQRQPNYINKSFHLSLNPQTPSSVNHDSAPNINSSLKRTKKKKRLQRKQLLKQQIERNTFWQINGAKKDINQQATDQNGDSSHQESSTKIDVNSMWDALKETEQQIIAQQNRLKNRKQQKMSDRQLLTALFKNDTFDADPIKFTTEAIKQQRKALNMRTTQENKREKKIKKQALKKQQKLTQKKGSNKYKDVAIGKNKKNIKEWKDKKAMKQKSDMRTKGDQIKKQISLMKLKSMSRKKIKIANEEAINKKYSGKYARYIHKKLTQKMSQISKENQKKRKWRIR